MIAAHGGPIGWWLRYGALFIPFQDPNLPLYGGPPSSRQLHEVSRLEGSSSSWQYQSPEWRDNGRTYTDGYSGTVRCND
jgi:hypothetical protein